MCWPTRSGLLADFLLVSTADRTLRIGVGLASTDASEGALRGDEVSEGDDETAGEKSSETRAESLSVAEATRRRAAFISRVHDETEWELTGRAHHAFGL